MGLKILQIFRPLNLLMVALTQWLVAEFLILKTFRAHEIYWEMSPSFLLKIIVATLLTTAAGYVINDIFDQKTDKINRPKRVVVGEIISQKIAVWIYILLIISLLALNILIVGASQPSAKELNSWIFGSISVALFLYAWLLKATPILGNLLVAILCAAVPLVLLFQEKRAFEVLKMNHPEAYILMKKTVIGYAIFAAMTTFLREIIKDLEDRKGDAAAGLTTTAVFFGEKKCRYFAFIFSLGIAFFLLKTAQIFSALNAATAIFWGFLAASLGLVSFIYIKITRGREPADYRRISLIIKVLMGVGLLFLAAQN